MTSNTAENQGHVVRVLETVEIRGTIKHQATLLEILPSHQNFTWPRGTATRNALPCCFVPLDLYNPAGYMGSLSLTSCRRRWRVGG